jgi:hypothetical protein
MLHRVAVRGAIWGAEATDRSVAGTVRWQGGAES